MGHFMKPLGYKVKDWLWLIKSFERRIHHWAHKFLSLVGRLVLIRVVLSSMPVYWFALAHVPKSILNKLRKLIFDFLWDSSSDRKHYRLVDWQLLSRPFEFWGWGIKKLEWFSVSLRLKSL